MRATLYARYSTDRQTENSIEDQLRAAVARIAAEGWAVVATHTDEGISGSVPVAMRAGGKALLADAIAGRFDVLVMEGLDRLSREISEAETIVKRLEHRGIRIIGTSDGYDTLTKGRKVMRIARGLVNELYLDDLREKTHRGMAGTLDRGLSTGGRSYGYRSVPTEGGFRMQIDPVEAAIVREVFETYASGVSARTIVYSLNQRGVASARGGLWALSAISGVATKGTGMINNRQYIGEVVWNKCQWIKDPETGKRRRLERPQSEWLTRTDESLRIVPQDIWDRCHQRRSTNKPGRVGGVPKTLFGGLLRCHACDGPVVAISSERYGCSVHRDRGPTGCANNRTVKRTLVDNRLISLVRDELLHPEALDELERELRAYQAEQAKASRPDMAAIKAKMQTTEDSIKRVVEAITMIGISPALAKQLRDLEAQQQRLKGELQERQAPASTGNLVDNVVSEYKRLMLRLRDVLGDQDREQTRAMLATFIGPVVLRHEGTECWAQIEEPAERLLRATVGGSSFEVVAGARNLNQRRIRIA